MSKNQNSIRVLSANVRGLGQFQKRTDVFEYLKSKKCHIYCLQDVHFTREKENNIKLQWDGQVVFNSYTNNSRGVCILFDNNFEYILHKEKKDNDGNFLALDITIENKKVTLITIYGPNSDKPKFFEQLENTITDFKNESYIICGDFNIVQDAELDTYNYSSINNPKARGKLLEIRHNLNLVDPFRQLFPDKKRYTWRKSNPIKQARLDYFLISENFMSNVADVQINPGYRSDHSMIILNVQLNEFVKGRGLWKFNSTLLSDKDYVSKVKSCITNVKKQYAVPVYELDNIESIDNNDIQFSISDQLFLETLMMEIRGKTISFSSFKKKQKLKQENTLIKEIEILENKTDNTHTDLEILETKHTELENLRKEKIKGQIIRSKSSLVEDNEKPSKYFLNLESRNFVNKTITRLQKDNGEIIRNQKEILNEIKNFYLDLYSKKEVESLDLENVLDNFDIPKLTNNESSKLEGKISLSEALAVLKNMKNNKSPGTDGFTAEFFKFFWSDLGIFIVRSINDAYEKGELSVTQKQGIITCIPKGDKPRQFMQNWRPISLLNVIYKIASGCIASRIKNILPSIISEDQTGFLSGRYIGENIRIVYDIMQYTESKNIPGMFILIDFFKAFDSVSWDFIFNVLDFFKFGESIKKWVKLFFTNISSAINQNNILSDFFILKRGCRQGDPISSYLFLLCAEILSLLVKHNKSISGIVIDDTELKLSQFADDTTLILDGSKTAFDEAMNVIEFFGKISGLNINVSKTRVIWIGKKKFCGETFNHRLKLNWNQTSFNVLGIEFSTDLDQIVKINFEKKIEQIKSILHSWSSRYLTPLGRITILKTLIISKLNYLFISLPNPPPQMLDKLNSMFYEFVWNSKNDRINRNVLIQKYFSGGLKMIHLQKFIESLKITWIRRTLINNGKYRTIFYTIVKNPKSIYTQGKTACINISKKNK